MKSMDDLEQLLGRTFQCRCGREHTVPVRRVIYEANALERIPETLSGLTRSRSIAIFADARTWAIAGEAANSMLESSGWKTQVVVVPDGESHGPVCDDVTHERLLQETGEAGIALAAGSGVINDLAKWFAFDRGIPYAVAATAATMNGYTAANVAPALKGVKSLISAQAPMALFADPATIEQAPYALTTAGLGDAMAKPVSTADWLMNRQFRGEYFCGYCSEMINHLEPQYLNHPEALRARESGAIAALFQALVYSGIAMTLIGTSVPASGGEHLLSHTLDMMSGVDGTPHDLHGRQVGLGTIFASALYEKLLAIETPVARAMPAEIDRRFWGPFARGIDDQYRLKLPEMATIGDCVAQTSRWDSFREAAQRQVRAPDQIKNCLRRAGAAHTFEDIGCDGNRIEQAVRHMHEIRKRPTVVDLAWLLGVLPDAGDEIIEQWLR